MDDETQLSVGAWALETFPGGDPASPRKALRALEEVVELCLAAGASGSDVSKAVADAVAREMLGSPQGFFTGKPAPEKVPVEAADVLITLYALAHERGFDIHEHVGAKMKINRSRRWKANGDGTGYHVKEAS